MSFCTHSPGWLVPKTVLRSLYGFTIVAAVAAADRAGAQSYCPTELTVGVRDDAPPFSFRLPDTAPDVPENESCGHFPQDYLPGYAGYTIQLCREYLRDLRLRCGSVEITVEPMSVDVGERYAGLAAEDPPFDMLCGATTATVTLSAELPRSPYTFLTSTSALAGPGLRDDLSCRVGVVGGTTSDPARQDRVEDPRRLDRWSDFTRRHPICKKIYLDRAKTFGSTLEGILALATETDGISDARQIDLLVDDHHILDWYWRNLDRLGEVIGLTDREVAPPDTVEHFVDLRDRLEEIKSALTLIPVGISIEPYAVFGPVERRDLIADFSRYLTRAQQDAGGDYTTLLRRCFKRNVDRSFWVLMDFQSRVRDGNPLTPPSPAVQ